MTKKIKVSDLLSTIPGVATLYIRDEPDYTRLRFRRYGSPELTEIEFEKVKANQKSLIGFENVFEIWVDETGRRWDIFVTDVEVVEG